MGTSGGYTPPAAVAQDFWRSPQVTGGVPPDGLNDTNDLIARNGLVGIGVPFVTGTPTAQLDVANGARTGVDRRAAPTALYVTGSLSGISTGITPPSAGVEFLDSDQVLGIGVAEDGIYATGSQAAASLTLMNKGLAIHRKIWQATAAAAQDDLWSMAATAANQAIVHNARLGPGAVLVSSHSIAHVEGIGPLNVRQQFTITSNGVAGLVGVRIEPDMAQLGNTSLRVGEDRINNRKLVLWDDTDHASAHQFFGLGVNNQTLRYQVSDTASGHRFYAATAVGTSRALMVLRGDSAAGIGLTGVNAPLADPNGTAEPRLGGLTVGGNAATPPVVTAINPSSPILTLVRAGTGGVRQGSAASFDLGTWSAATNPPSFPSYTQMDIRLANGNTSLPDTTVLTLRSDGQIVIPLAPTPTVAGAGYLTRDSATGIVHQAASPPFKRFAATAVTDASGNASFNMLPAGFTAAPVVVADIQAAASANPIDYRIVSLSAAAVVINVKVSVSVLVPLIGLTLVQAPVNAAGVTVHVVAVPSGAVA